MAPSLKIAVLIFASFVLVHGDDPPATTTQRPTTRPATVPATSPPASSGCDGTGWFPVHDDKCFKLITEWKTHEQAVVACRNEKLSSESYAPTLATIKSAEEQAALNSHIFNQAPVIVEGNVWIGAQRLDSHIFTWYDGSIVGEGGAFTNWAPGSPSNVSRKACVVMQSVYSRNVNGQWHDVACSIPNYFVCQKAQKWDFARIGEDYLRTKAKFQELAADYEQLKQEFHGQVNNIPIGFIYVQLPSALSPQDLWPLLTWTHVSSTYDGVFFRVEGKGSSEFGMTQEESSPRIEFIENSNTAGGVANAKRGISKGSVSDWMYTGNSWSSGSGYSSVRLWMSGADVKPRNMAVRVWKRTG